MPRSILQGRYLRSSPSPPYMEKVLGYSPTAYWPLWETSGAVATEIINGWDGTYVGVTLGYPGIGDGRTAPYFDGANDYVDMYTVGLRNAFNSQEGSLLIWLRVFNLGVWTDGTNRYALYFAVDGNNRVRIWRHPNNYQLNYEYKAGGVSEAHSTPGLNYTVWWSMVLTWSKSADEFRCYYDGVQLDYTHTGLGNWVGLLNANTTLLGALTMVPANPWYGYIAHVALWAGRVLTIGDAQDLARVH